ncbi:hypothetical protein IEQ34_000415 [Dendrobium chrysotoxum]|uniref:Uncharacterized protein n=1 Tax=Dendrobium chrysotoxum TaxID=161865 RepID=A0AAV7HQF1_DENCH|nr:hypothetical protein IEQ34_000415 [Dendrobium chrysotoxum]
MKVVRNNWYEPRDNLRPSERTMSALAAINSLELVEECGVDDSLKFSLGLSSDEVECRKWVRETNEIIIVKKPKMEEGPMPYYL